MHINLFIDFAVGLADTLQSELMLYGVDVQIFFPNTMFTSGYDEENKTKPAIVKKIEEADDGITADQGAVTLLKGLESGHAHISGDTITNMFRASTRGAAYRSNWLLDGLLDFVAYVRCFYISHACRLIIHADRCARVEDVTR